MVLKAKYRHYLPILSATLTSDGQGGNTATWATATSEWFRVVPLSGSRSLESGGVKFKKAIELYANKYSGNTITEANRITFNGDNYTIHSITPSEKLDEIKIVAYV